MNEVRLRENRVTDSTKTVDANRDPLTGSPGAHPVGAGVGAAGGGAAGAAIGAAVGGPVGAAVGLVAGGIAGGLAGKWAAESVNPTAEDAYWRENYNSQPWVERTYTYDDYGPAFQSGYETYAKHHGTGRKFEEIEPEMRRDWDRVKGKSRLDWERAKVASRAAWERVDQARGTGAGCECE
jgi:phage tail tape-measure protein